MTATPQRTFRAAALDRAASPEQFDHLVVITKPSDWIWAAVICLLLVAAIIWGIVGRIPTRVSGEGILISNGDRVVDAVSAAAGRLASVSVTVGDHVVKGQPIARIVQTDIEQKHSEAVAVLGEKQREYAVLAARVQSELVVKSQNFAKLEDALNQVIRATTQRVQFLTVDVRNLEDLLAKGFTTRKNLSDRREELTSAQQRLDDTRNQILKLRADKTDLETQRDRELRQAQFSLNEAERQVSATEESLSQNTQVISPIEGRVVEVKISTGSVLAVGTAVVEIESEGNKLEAVIYIPPDQGKRIKPGMQVQLEPSTVKREEFGMMLGTVETVSDFPMTPQGMTAVLHNETLVTRFSHDGAPYAAKVVLEQDASTTTGYRWAVGNGPNLRLTSGTLTRAEITTRHQRPLDLVIPLIRHLTGIDG
ncbi:MAG TPA: NHLP bacteriocin system secretion protein [Steroidobacteraceae bacterium]|nr:NHLP bacteriocin system secretion protein [Steroidobacteraceae bacterium]